MVKKRIVELIYNEYKSKEELSAQEQILIEAASKSSLNAYSPYSGFSVGAAVMLDTGEIITGNNRENAAFPAGICAEHSAIACAGSNYPGSAITSLAICARKKKILTDEPVSPCGKCRQVISEEEDRSGKQIRIILHGVSRTLVIDGIKNLLPLHFSSSAISY
ncbi:MAG: cytidine deaminase [Bacteroidales bacterium]|nr:cytidine deaminase [Bacteroidales bacterium]